MSFTELLLFNIVLKKKKNITIMRTPNNNIAHAKGTKSPTKKKQTPNQVKMRKKINSEK